jgi:uncharacterized ubiquitin-like protein YukD
MGSTSLPSLPERDCHDVGLIIQNFVQFEKERVNEYLKQTNDMNTLNAVFKVFNLAIKYNYQVKKLIFVKAKNISKSKIISIKKISKLEIKIKNELQSFNFESKDSFFQSSILNSLFELILNIFSNICQHKTFYTKYLQETFIDCFITVASLYCENVQVI